MKKIYSICAIFLSLIAFSARIFAEVKLQSDCQRISKVIQELEDELKKISDLRNSLDTSWIPQPLPWDYQIRLDERKIQIIKDIIYFKKLLAELEAEG